MFNKVVGATVLVALLTSTSVLGEDGPPRPRVRYASTLPDTCNFFIDFPSKNESGKCYLTGGPICERECHTYLNDQFRGARCIDEMVGGGGGDKCECQSACAIGALWGDPHVLTLDGRAFEYHGLCLVTAMATINPMPGLPRIELRTRNEPFDAAEIATVPRSAELVFPDWHLAVEIDREVKVNGQPTALPHRVTIAEEGRPVRIEITMVNRETAQDGVVESFRIITSFGMSVIFDKATEPKHAEASALFVAIPKSPAFFNNVRGLLGRFDRNISNDNTDEWGVQRSMDDPLQVWQLGDSFCVHPNERTPQYVQKMHSKQLAERMTNCENNADKNRRMTTECNARLKAHPCAVASGQQQEEFPRIIRACRIDTCFAANERVERDSICAAIHASNMICNAHINCD